MPRKNQIKVRTNEEAHQALTERAELEGVSLNQFCLYALAASLFDQDIPTLRPDRTSTEGLDDLFTMDSTGDICQQ